MCGIAGYRRSQGEPLRREFLRPMCDRLAHRGPDGHGEYFDPDIALGHRRLSIVDIKGGAQPMGNEDGSIQVVFNGEIYNQQELRHTLEQKGHHFRTRCDTEVLVHLYEEERERTPELLNGMFAFAVWDQRKRALFLARDRSGEKPLYYSTCLPGLAICFASELKALLDLPGFTKDIRPESVIEFLSNSYIADPETIYRQVQRLRAGESLTVTWDGVQRRRYWSPQLQCAEHHSFARCSERLLHMVADAVQSCGMSDVPVGAFLSGGLDSSAVVACMAAPGTEPVKTFSIGFASPEYDERRYAQLIASRFRTDHHEAVVDADAEDLLNIFVEQYDEPFGDASAIPALRVAQLASHHVKVALSGDGADELFGGYARYLKTIRRSLNALLPSRFRRLDAAPWWIHQQLSVVSSSRRINALLTRSCVENYYRATSMTDENTLSRILHPVLRESAGGYAPKLQLEERFQPHHDLPLLQQMQLVDMETYLPADILVKMDRATMAASIESRAPWLDHHLAEYAGTLPPHFMLHRGITKAVVRRAFRSRLPSTTLTRTKMGFSVPLARWLRTSLKTQFEAFVYTAGMQNYLNLSEVRRLWHEHQSVAHDDHSWILWNIFVLSRWHHRYQRPSESPTLTLPAQPCQVLP